MHREAADAADNSQHKRVTCIHIAARVLAGPFWFGLGGLGPGPDPFGLAWGARVLGRTLLVWLGGPGSWAGPAYTINKLDSDKDVHIIRLINLTVIRMLI